MTTIREVPAIYEGNRLLRLLDDLEGIAKDETVLVTIAPFPFTDQPMPSELDEKIAIQVAIEAVVETQGWVAVNNPEWAEQIAEDDSLLEWKPLG